MSQPLLEVRPHLATLADGRVVERVLEGEIELFEILMRRYNQRLYRVTRSVVDSAQEAEDVVQEAWVRTFDKLATFRGEASFATWVTRIAVHEALARVRRRRPTTPLDDAFPPPRPGPRGPEADTANDELAALLREAIATLPRSLRPVFVLREVEGLGAEEIAGLLGITAGAARVRLHRAKLHLRRVLDMRLGEEARRLYLFDGRRCDRLVERVFDALSSRAPRRD